MKLCISKKKRGGHEIENYQKDQMKKIRVIYFKVELQHTRSLFNIIFCQTQYIMQCCDKK